MDTGNADAVKINLVPEEGFVEDVNPDGSKKFTCKQCGKTCKTKQSMKQHIANTHKKQAMKRTASKSENVGRKAAKKFFEEEDIITEESAGTPIQESTHIDPFDHTSLLDDYCDNLLGEANWNEGDFNLNGTVDNYVENKKSFEHEESIDISPDQDHNYLKENEEPSLLKATILSLKLDIQKRDSIINEKDDDLATAKVELENFAIAAHDLRKENSDKTDALDTVTAQINSIEKERNAEKARIKLLEEGRKEDKARINKYGASLKTLIKENENNFGNNANTIKDKNKKIKEAETNQKKLADRLAEVENLLDENKEGSADKKQAA